MAKNDISDLLDDAEDDSEFDGIDNDEQPGKESSQYFARRRIEELLEQKRLERMLNDFDEYLEA